MPLPAISEVRGRATSMSPEQTGAFYERLLEKLASLDKFQHVIRSAESAGQAISIGLEEVQSLISFAVCGIFLVDDKEGSFQFSASHPPELALSLEQMVGQEIKSGTFAWALRQTRPVIVRREEDGARVLFCVLTTQSRTLGMFAGLISGQDDNAAEDSLGLLSLVLLGMTYTLENHTLVQQLREYNEHLQELVSQRSAEILETNLQLQKEIGERKLREAELRAAKEVVEEADRSKSEFLAMMSHEIRTPMNGVIGFANLLESSPLNEEQMECVRLLNLSSQQLLCLLNDVLDLSKIEAGQLYLEQHPFQLRELIHDLVDLSVLRARERRVELSCDLDEEVPETMVGDSTRLRQIVMNLLTNALKFTEKGEICLSVHYQAGAAGKAASLLWRVEDTGIGISSDKIGLLFQPFKQADSSTTRKYGGTGLGLAICRKLCEKMGGKIWVESQPGAGSRFHFTLPLTMVCLPEEDYSSQLRDRTVILISPFPRQREQLTRRLRAMGAVVETGSIEEGAWMEVPGQLIVLDPDSCADLGEFSRLVPRLEDHRGIILASTRAQRKVYSQMLGEPWHYVIKPARAEDFRRALLAASGRQVSLKAVTPETRPLPETMVLPATSLRIVLADDNAINQKIGQKMLAKLGYRARVVGNGREVLEVLGAGPCDILFLDLEMPELDGRATARAIRAGEAGRAGRRIYIVAMTAHGEIEKSSCLEAGMNEFLTKPVRIESLQRVLARVPAEYLPEVADQVVAPPLC